MLIRVPLPCPSLHLPLNVYPFLWIPLQLSAFPSSCLNSMVTTPLNFNIFSPKLSLSHSFSAVSMRLRTVLLFVSFSLLCVCPLQGRSLSTSSSSLFFSLFSFFLFTFNQFILFLIYSQLFMAHNVLLRLSPSEDHRWSLIMAYLPSDLISTMRM